MEKTKDSPGIIVPPPLFFVAVFFLSFLLQRLFPIQLSFFQTLTAHILSAVICTGGLCFIVPALGQFIRTKNTVITIKSASSLQTSGVYSITRNPMYLGSSMAYLGLAFIFGNWWTVVLLPILILLVTRLIILREEKYLMRSFGNSYADYKEKVRRWI